MTGWASTPRGRKELTAAGLFCLAFAAVPLLTTELYPFSRAPMFADAPRQYCEYALVTPDGRRLTDAADLRPFGLQRNYWGNPLGVGVGFRPAPAVDDFGRVASRVEVFAIVAPRLKLHPDWPWVEVEQTVIGPTDADHVGVVERRTLHVDNPSYRPGGS